jgi:glycosyltransferase involved in cell wall biosynthesis
MSIAVVIPAYNSMKYFRETLESVLGQTLPPDEVIVIDDGSTDGTPDFAESYGHPVRVLHRTRQRQAANRNFGAQEATSEWVAFVDHDDVWAPNKLELQMAELNRTQADLCYTGRILLKQRGDTFSLDRIVETPSPENLRPWLYKDVSFLASSVLMRRSTLLASGGFNPNFKYAEDWDHWMRLFHSGCKFAFCPEPLLIYRCHTNNASTANPLDVLDEVNQIYQAHIVPHLSPFRRILRHGYFWSRLEANAARAMRAAGDRRDLAMMARCIIHWPFEDWNRYKVFAHMMYMHLRRLVQRPSSAEPSA